jgi:hypothetical protein
MPSSLPPPSNALVATTPLSVTSSIPSPTEEARLNNATPAPLYPRRTTMILPQSTSPLTVASSAHGGSRSLSPQYHHTKRDSARQQQALECDYDVQPTELYQAIEANRTRKPNCKPPLGSCAKNPMANCVGVCCLFMPPSSFKHPPKSLKCSWPNTPKAPVAKTIKACYPCTWLCAIHPVTLPLSKNC